jgi:hypothetical protein
MGAPAANMQWSFSFGNGFQGTDLTQNDLFVMVYAPNTQSGGQVRCTNAVTCCIKAGGTMSGGRCI